MSFLSSIPPDSPLSATPENADQLLKAYLAEDRVLRGRSSHSSLSSVSSTDVLIWRVADHGSLSRAIASNNDAVDRPRHRGPGSSSSPHSCSSRGRGATVQRPEGLGIMESRSPSRDTGSLSIYRLAPYSLPPADGTSCNHSAPNLLIGTQPSPDGRFFVRPLPNSSAGHRDSTIYLMPNVRDPDDDHKRSHSLSSIPPAKPSLINKGSFYISPTNSPHLSSDDRSFAKNPLPSFLSVPMTPPADADPLPTASPTMSSGSEGVEFGEGARLKEHKDRPSRKRRGRKLLDLPPAEPKTLISTPYSSTSKTLISVPYSSTSSFGTPAFHPPEPKSLVSVPYSSISSPSSLSSRKLPDEESRGRPRWPRERRRPSTPGGLQRVNSSSKKKTKGKNSIGIPMPEYKKKPSFTVPSLPSLSPKKKWAVGDRVSGLFSGRIFNRLEVKEIIDTSVRNYESPDPSRRYSRARNTDNPLALVLDTDSDSTPATGTAKKLPPLPKSASLRAKSAASTRASSRDSMAAERGSPAIGSEPRDSDDSDSIRESFLMDSQSQMEEEEREEREEREEGGEEFTEEEDEPPAFDITSDLAIAVAEEETVLPFQSRNRRLYQNPSLPSIPELSPSLGRGGRRFSPTSAPAVPTHSLPPGTPTSRLSPVDPGSSATASSLPPPIPPKSHSRRSTMSIQTPASPITTARSPTLPHTPTLPQSPTRRYIVPPPTPTTVRDSRIQSPHIPSENLDWTAFQMAIAGPTGDYLMDGHSVDGENPDASTNDSIVDWFHSYNFDSVGAMVRPDASDSNPSQPPLELSWPPATAAEEQEPPPLESDAGSSSNRTSSLLQQPAELDTNECGEKIKMGCNFNDGSLGDYLSWEVNLLQVVDDGEPPESL